MLTTERRPAAPATASPALIASFLDDGRAVLLLSGRLDDTAPYRMEEHIAALLDHDVRDLTVVADSLVEAPHGVIDLLVRTQDHLSSRRGVVRVFGLRPEAVVG